jgi:hypothetical protein
LTTALLPYQQEVMSRGPVYHSAARITEQHKKSWTTFHTTKRIRTIP